MWSRMMHNYAFVYINGNIHVSHRLCINIPDSKVHGANLGPIWGRQDPGGPRVGPMNLAIWDVVITFECDGCEETCSPKIVSVYISHLNYTYTKMPFILPTPFQTLSYFLFISFHSGTNGRGMGRNFASVPTKIATIFRKCTLSNVFCQPPCFLKYIRLL